MNKQKIIEMRILALAKVVSERLINDPDKIIAKSNIARWSKNQHAAYHDEWLDILNEPIEKILFVLKSEDENSVRLRSSSPFAVVVKPKERWRIIRDIK